MLWWIGLDSNQRGTRSPDLQSGLFNHSSTYPYLTYNTAFQNSADEIIIDLFYKLNVINKAFSYGGEETELNRYISGFILAL